MSVYQFDVIVPENHICVLPTAIPVGAKVRIVIDNIQESVQPKKRKSLQLGLYEGKIKMSLYLIVSG